MRTPQGNAKRFMVWRAYTELYSEMLVRPSIRQVADRAGLAFSTASHLLRTLSCYERKAETSMTSHGSRFDYKIVSQVEEETATADAFIQDNNKKGAKW